MNTQPPCPDPPLPPFPGLYFAILDFTHLPRILSLCPLHHSPQPPPSPALAPDEGGRGMGPQNLFRDSKFSASSGTLPWRASYIPLSWARLPQMEPRPHQAAPRTLRPPQDPPFHHPPAPFRSRASEFISRF